MTVLDRRTELELEAAVKGFESACFRGQDVKVADHFPCGDHPLFKEIATELIRVDMELRWKSGDRIGATSYEASAPSVFADAKSRGEIAFEEFRLRREAGEEVNPQEYARRFDIDTDIWQRTMATRRDDDVESARSSAALRDVAELVAHTESMPAVGASVFGFELRDELGQGTFGKVFLAQQSGLADRFVVIKIISRVSDEPARLAQLQHTHIVPIFSVHRDESWQAICMPFFGRATLAHALGVVTGPRSAERVAAPSAGSARVPWALRIARDVADGLAHAHDREIVHRDIKPANILLADDGRAMLLDFNLSDHAVAGGPANLFVGGTLPYMPAEQLRAIENGDSVGLSADVFALGAVLYQMLTLQQPFPEVPKTGFRSAIEQMVQARREGPRPLAAANRDVSPAVTAIVEKCLAMDPADRYATAGQLAEDLAAELDDRPLIHAPNPSLRERFFKWSRRHPRLMSGGSVAAAFGTAVVVMAGLWWASHQRSLDLEAEHDLHTFLASSAETRMALSSIDAAPELRAAAVARARRELAEFNVGEGTGWQSDPRFARLSETHREQLTERLYTIAYMAARTSAGEAADRNGSERTEQLKSAAQLCDLAIRLRGDDARAAGQLRQRLRDQLNHRSSDPPVAILDTGEFEDDYLAAISALDAKAWREAERRLHRVLESQPTDEAAWLALGLAHVGSGALAKAEACFSTVIRLSPNSYMAHLRRAELRLEARQFALAEADLNIVIRSRPELGTPYAYRAMARYGLNRLTPAVDDITRAINLGSPETRLLFIRSKWREELGDIAGSDADREEGLRRTPVGVKGWLARGMAKLKQDPQSAVDDFKMAVRLDPTSTDALRNVAYVYAEPLNDPRRALEYFDEILALEPENLAVQAARGVLLARLGDCEAAAAAARAVAENDLDAKGSLQVASIYAILARHDSEDAPTAVRWLAQAVLLDPRIARPAGVDSDLAAIRDREDFQFVIRAAAQLQSIAAGRSPAQNRPPAQNGAAPPPALPSHPE